MKQSQKRGNLAEISGKKTKLNMKDIFVYCKN